MVLEWGGARALVRLDRNERRTEVAVTGDVAEDCHNLFDIIRAHLTVLHGKVPVIEEVQTLDDPETWLSAYLPFPFAAGAVGSSAGLPCQSGATLCAFQVSHAALSSATRCGSVVARLWASPGSLERS